MFEKFHYDRLRNDRALGNGKSDNNKNNNNNVCSDWGPVSGSDSYALLFLLLPHTDFFHGIDHLGQ